MRLPVNLLKILMAVLLSHMPKIMLAYGCEVNQVAVSIQGSYTACKLT